MKDQFVIACLADLSMKEEVVSHAAFFARMLNKGLILLYVQDKKYGNATTTEAEQQIQSLENRLSDLKPAHVIMKGDIKEVVNALPTLLNGVVAIVGVNAKAPNGSLTHPRVVLRLFRQCKIAYLTVQQKLGNAHDYDRIAFGVDFRKESKDKLVWASYFARFNNSRLMMMHFHYSDQGLLNKWKNNVRFMDKLFANLGVTYTDQVVTGHALFPETIICDNAAQSGCGLLVSVTTDTRDLDVIEWVAGVAEHRTIRNSARMPVLYINPRNDIYVLCD